MITLPADAPEWARVMAQEIQQEIENAWTRPLQVFSTTNKPSPTDPRWLWRPFVVSDGAGNKWVAISNGTTLRYLEGSAV